MGGGARFWCDVLAVLLGAWRHQSNATQFKEQHKKCFTKFNAEIDKVIAPYKESAVAQTGVTHA